MSLLYTPSDLNAYFSPPDLPPPSAVEISKSDAFFYKSKFAHIWTCALYDEIPDVKVERLSVARDEKLSKMDSQKLQTMAVKTSFGVPMQNLRRLPEVLLLGHTNAGKSTLVNNLLLTKQQAKTANADTELAYVSSRAGFTKCLNCFTVGNRLRVVDSPGYGEFAIHDQGKVVLDYIAHRKQLRRVFMLIDGTVGARDEDLVLIDHLTANGVAFEIVMTKADEVFRKVHKRLGKKSLNRAYATELNSKVVEHFARIIGDAGFAELAMRPRIFFNNSKSTELVPKRYGFREIRHAILESTSVSI